MKFFAGMHPSFGSMTSKPFSFSRSSMPMCSALSFCASFFAIVVFPDASGPRRIMYMDGYLIKSFSVSCACLIIDLKVPCGISLLFAGIITVSVLLLSLRYFWWLPFWDMKINPFFFRTLIIWLEDWSLGMF